VASLAALPLEQTRSLLAEVIRAHLLQESPPGRYRLHDLVRLHLNELARGSVLECHEATQRVLDHYLHTARAADRALDSRSDAIPGTPLAPGVVPEPTTDVAGALRWLTAERQVLVAAVDYAEENAFDDHAWRLAQTLQALLGTRKQWHDLLRTQRTAVRAAQRLADPLAQMHAHRGLGRAYVGLGRHDQAHMHLALALEFAASLGDPICLAHAHRALGMFFASQGDFEGGLAHDERALEIYAGAENPVGQATALNAVGWQLAHLGRHEVAVARCTQALAIYEELGDRQGQALTWDSLGYARFGLGDYPEAAAAYQRAVDMFRELGHAVLMGSGLVALGDIHQAAGHPGPARQAWQAALTIYAEAGDPTSASEGVRERLRRIPV
jgi:tetratricopeptide (TPR) repeat protein